MLSQPEVAETMLGPGLPTLKIGGGPQPLVYLPGLSLHPGFPAGRERTLAVSGWEPLLEQYTIYRVGRRVRPVGTTFHEMAEDVAATLEQMPRPIDLMGASTGGAIALAVAATRPELVRRLTVVISGVRLSEVGRNKAASASRAAAAGRWRRAYAEVMPIGSTSARGRALMAALGWLLGPRLIGIPEDPTMLLAELAAWERYDAETLVTRVRCPTLVIGTQHDRMFTATATRELGQLLETATTVIVPGLAHDFPPDAIREHIAPFLAHEARHG
jgi:pimeloyl-ACP methyl ester carboxylesterase